MTQDEIEAARQQPPVYIEDGGCAEEYGAVSTVDSDIATFRKDEADEEAEALA